MANRRFLKANESEESVRQRAFNDGIDKAANISEKVYNQINKKKATDRQRAMEDFKTSLQLTEMSGERVTTDQVKDFRNNKFQEFDDNGEQTGLGKFYSNLDTKRETKQRHADNERALKTEERMGKVTAAAYSEDQNNLPFRQRQDAEKMRLASELRQRENSAKAKQDKTKTDDIRERTVPGLGLAYTKNDAKQLKTGAEMKGKFDRQIGEMIALRKKYGVEYANREAVARGQQLAKDLLLTYKNLAKLGVLSVSDEKIVNAIIPSDPLGQDWMPFQDSIAHALDKFKYDIDEDYKTTLKMRLIETNDSVNTRSAAPDRTKNQAPPADSIDRKEKIRLTKEAMGIK